MTGGTGIFSSVTCKMSLGMSAAPSSKTPPKLTLVILVSFTIDPPSSDAWKYDSETMKIWDRNWGKGSSASNESSVFKAALPRR